MQFNFSHVVMHVSDLEIIYGIQAKIQLWKTLSLSLYVYIYIYIYVKCIYPLSQQFYFGELILCMYLYTYESDFVYKGIVVALFIIRKLLFISQLWIQSMWNDFTKFGLWFLASFHSEAEHNLIHCSFLSLGLPLNKVLSLGKSLDWFWLRILQGVS